MIVPNQHGFVGGKSTVTNLLTLQERAQVDLEVIDLYKSILTRPSIELTTRSLPQYCVPPGHYACLTGGYWNCHKDSVKFDYLHSLDLFVCRPENHRVLIWDLTCLTYFSMICWLLLGRTIRCFERSENFCLTFVPTRTPSACKCALTRLCSSAQEITWKSSIWCALTYPFTALSSLFICTSWKKSSVWELHQPGSGCGFLCALSCVEHVNGICTRVRRTQGFISQTSKGIDGSASLRSLYSTLVKQSLKYASTIWSHSRFSGIL